MKSKLVFITIFTAIFLSLTSWVCFTEVVNEVLSWLEKSQVVVLGSLNRTLYAIGLGLIPISGYLATILTKHNSITNWLMQTLNVTLGVLFTFIIAYLISNRVRETSSRLLPDYITQEPFSGYWNFTLYVGLLFYVGSLMIWIKFKDNNK